MIQQTYKPKRGAHFIHTKTGSEFWLYRIKSETEYVLCDQSDFSIRAHFATHHPDDLQAVQKQGHPIVSRPKKQVPGDKIKADELTQFFKSLNIPVNCQECDKPLIAFTDYGRRSVSAHILPKSKFESVAMNEDNILFLGAGYLGGCHCHDDWDSCIETRMEMKVYPTALKRYQKILPFFNNGHEINMANDYLGL